MKPTIFASASALLLAGCDQYGGATYTLYRSSLTDANLRVHVATFDAAESEEYNRENCTLAAKLFVSQLDVRTKFWCEKGRYKK